MRRLFYGRLNDGLLQMRRLFHAGLNHSTSCLFLGNEGSIQNSRMTNRVLWV